MDFSEMGIETSDLHRSLMMVHAAGGHCLSVEDEDRIQQGHMNKR